MLKAAQIRPATQDDVTGIVALVNEQARRGNLLPRSAAAIQATLADWLVAETDGDGVTGCVSLLPYTSGLVEVRSLAVQDKAQGQGVGLQLVESLIQEAKRRRVPTLFALTRAVGFFERCGFAVTERHLFPEKVWRDCHQCPLRHNCDETAMVLHLAESRDWRLEMNGAYSVLHIAHSIRNTQYAID
jgi:N-acetylglutamate synthase-like GNAT family acetyltransferase